MYLLVLAQLQLGIAFWLLLSAAVGFVLIAVANWLYQRPLSQTVAELFDQDATLRPREEPPDPNAELVSIETPDGVTLSGAILSSGETDKPRPLVVFCPEFASNKWAARHYAEGLLDAGFDVLTFDFSCQGDSEWRHGYTPCYWLSEHELVDLRAVIDFVQSDDRFKGRLAGVMGFSRGAGAALVVAAERPEVPAVFVEAVFSTYALSMLFVERWARWELSPFEYRILPKWHIRWSVIKAQRIVEKRRGCRFVYLEGRLKSLANRPVQFVSGARDTYVPEPIISSVVREAGHDPITSLIRIPKAKHNQGRELAPEEFDAAAVSVFSKVTARQHELA